ncbi:MAG TPA: mercuric reductase [Rhabdochlamydiaceae bacterium]|jgi:pyruvate/2-oxoglutarate dehydrogenase complex dihydrolipoamide dehydrogenase (E3) component
MSKGQSILEQYIQDLHNDVFPKGWENPAPKKIYDLVVIGGGLGGMTAATVAAQLNASVALIEKQHLGGECLNVGCIPSKALLRSSRCAAQVRDAAEFGIEVPAGWKVNFSAVAQRVRRCQSTISPQDSAEHFKKLGIDVFFGMGSFSSHDAITVKGETVRFKKAIIATGTSPQVPSIEGMETSEYLTNQIIFNLTTLPSQLVVMGAGPIGCELSQAFLRFGSQVTLITRGASLLPRDDSLAAERLQEVFEKEGMKILMKTQVKRIEKKGREKILHLDNGKKLSCDALLIAIGRLPQMEGLNLQKGGVMFDLKSGITADETLKTSNPNVYVVGDVGSPHKFTHIAMELGQMAAYNALRGEDRKRSSLVIPWSTYTDPEIAHVGLQEKEAEEKGIPLQTLLIEMQDNDRAILDGETTGFMKLHMHSGTGQILGGTLMAKHAGEMISELSVAIAGQKGISAIAEAIHPFPTQAEAIRASAAGLVQTLAKKNRLAG